MENNKLLSKEEFFDILTDSTITKIEDLRVFQAIYSSENHCAKASEIGRLLGGKSKKPAGPINLQIGRLAKRIKTKYDIDFTIRENQKFKFWDIFFDGWDLGKFFIWKLKPNLILAMESANLTGEVLFASEISPRSSSKLIEGAKRQITVNSYERNNQARRLCIEYYGVNCFVCGFNFEDIYGHLGKEFIHVHHLTQISDIGADYEIDPIKDLCPVCPNCHAMLHKNETPLTIEELKSVLRQRLNEKDLAPFS